MSRYYLLFLLGIFPSGFLKIVGAANCSKTNDLWPCITGACITIQQVCDGIKHCRDGSDETQELCRDMKCSSLSFRCKYGACISVLQVCDGVPDCADSSDEDTNYCRERRDNLPDDEVDDETSRKSCSGWGQMKCWSGQCVNIKDKCNGIRDCEDGSDETEVLCGAMSCTMKQFRCGYGACIPSTAKCNGKIECLDGTDELENLCKGDDITEAAITVITTMASTMKMITAPEKEISTDADTNASDLNIPFEDIIGEKNIPESSTKIIETKTLSTKPAQQSRNNLFDYKNTKSFHDGEIQEITDLKINSKQDHNQGTTYMNEDHVTRKPEIAVEQWYIYTTNESPISRPPFIDYTKLQNMRPTTQPTVKAVDIESMRPNLKMNSTQSGLPVANASTASLPRSENVHPTSVSILTESNTTASSSPTNDFTIMKKYDPSSAREPAVTRLLEKNTTSDENLAKPLIRPIKASDEVFTIIQSTPTTKVFKTIVQDDDNVYNQPTIFYNASQMPPTFNQAHSARRTQATTPTPKVQTTEVAKSDCILRGCEYPLKCALNMSPEHNPINSINNHGRTILEVGSEVKFSCADGHYLNGADRKRCNATGWSHDTPSCTPYCEVDFLSACRSPLKCIYNPPRNGTAIKISENFNERIVKEYSKITFSCLEGYHLEGRNSRECKMKGWEGNIPRCVNYCQAYGFHNCKWPLKCQIMDSNTGLIKDYSSHLALSWYYKVREESYIEFRCESGHELIGRSRSTCKNYGWDNAEPTCKKIPNPCDASLFNECPYPLKCQKYYAKSRSFFFLKLNSKPKIEQIEFSCAEGYVLTGDKFLICTRTGLDNAIPQCDEKITSPCDINLLNICVFPLTCKRYNKDNIQISNEQKPFIEYEKVKFNCEGDYLLHGTQLLTCKKRGWDNPIPKCLPSCKGKLVPKCESPLKCTLHHSSLNSYQQITNRSRPKYNMYPVGSQVSFRCGDGYELQGANRIICGIKGWSHEETMTMPKCSTPCDTKIFEKCKHPMSCNYHDTREWIKIQSYYMESTVPVGSIIDLINPQTFTVEGVIRLECTVTGWVRHMLNPAYS